MKVGIIGAGFTGLATAFDLTKAGYEVVIFEKDSRPGGLAIGFREKEWDWTLEEHYHHWFTNDNTILKLAEEVNQKVIIKRPKTSTLIKGSISQLDSPAALAKFPLLTLAERARMGLGLAALRYNPFWKPFDNYKAEEVLPKMVGEKGFKLIWHPLFEAKFGKFAKDVSLAWFWARIRKRTTSLAYPEGGFLGFAGKIGKEIERNGGKIYYNSQVIKISSGKDLILTIEKEKKTTKLKFDKIIVTLPSFLFKEIAPDLPQDYKEKIGNLKSLGATNLFLRLKKPFLKDGTYWLNVCEPDSPLMAVVEHTNFIDKSHYNNEHLVYIGHYLPQDHPYFTTKKEDLLKKFDPYLKKINENYKNNLIGLEFFKASFAQPVMPINYNKQIPPFLTPLKNVFLANIDQVYPWDRGTNYAVELGKKVTSLVLRSNE